MRRDVFTSYADIRYMPYAQLSRAHTAAFRAVGQLSARRHTLLISTYYLRHYLRHFELLLKNSDRVALKA